MGVGVIMKSYIEDVKDVEQIVDRLVRIVHLGLFGIDVHLNREVLVEEFLYGDRVILIVETCVGTGELK